MKIISFLQLQDSLKVMNNGFYSSVHILLRSRNINICLICKLDKLHVT